MKTKQLKPIVALLGKVADAKSIVPQWTMIQFRNGRISAQSEVLTISYQGDPMGDATIDIGMLKKIVANFDEFNIDSPGEGSCGTAKFKFPTDMGFNHVHLEFEHDSVVVLSGITDYLKSALKYVSDDVLRPIFNNICINDGYIAATDAFKLFYKDAALDKAINLLIPSEVAELMSAIGGDWLSAWESKSSGQVKVTNGPWEITYRQLDEKFPDWQAVVPKQCSVKVKVNRAELIDILKKAMLFTNQTTYQIELKINGTLDILAKDADLDTSFCDSVKGYEKVGGDIIIGLNAKKLLPIIQDQEGDFVDIQMNAPNNPVIINNHVLLMPLMLSE